MNAARPLNYLREKINKTPIPALLDRLGILDETYRVYWNLVSRLSDETIITRRIGGNQARFHASDRHEFRHLHDDFESNVLEDLLDRLHEDDTFFDIGAHIGIYSCLAGEKAIKGNVVAFEPNPEVRTRLQNNIQLNNLKNVEVLPFAVSNQNGIGKIVGWKVETDTQQKNAQSNEEQEIEIVQGDSIIEEEGLGSPSVVKIDVEGGEIDTLRGLKQTLQSSCRLVYVEVHEDALGEDVEEVRGLLEKAGFDQIKKISDTQTSIHHLRGIRSE